MFTVITIDDEPLVKKTLRVLIESYAEETFRVVGEAEDGKEGLGLIEELAPDLIVTDLNMPVMNGLELIERLHGRGGADIAVLSGYDDFDFAQAALRYGVIDYVLKPIRPEAVRQLLDRFCAKRLQEAEANAGRGEWITRCSDCAAGIAERVWLLDRHGVDTLLTGFLESVLERGLSREDAAESFQALATFIDSELAGRGAGPLGGPLGAPLPLEPDAALAGGANAERGEAESALQELSLLLHGKVDELERERRAGSHQGIRAAVAYIDANFYNASMSLAAAADAAGMSQAHFSRTFKKEIGVSFIDYVTRQRIERAKNLLDVPGTKTWEIAEAVGYQEYAHFAKVFRKYTGLTPTEYRRRGTAQS